MKLRIEKAVYGGSGLARVDGKAVFVPFTLPDEEVEAEITQDKGSFATAELQSVLQASPARAEPACPYFGRCGGCQYQHANYASQVETKLAILRESLQRAHVPEVPGIATITADPFAYRNRIRLHLQDKPFSLCYKIRNSGTNLPVQSCPIASPLLEHAIYILNREGESLRLATFVTEAELFIAPDESSVLLSLWTDRLDAAAMQFPHKALARLQRSIPQIRGIGVFVTEKDRPTDRLLAFSGVDSLLYPVADYSYRVSFGSFFQINRFLIDRLLRIVTEGERGATVWDLYAGVGLFSVPMARSFSEVTAVESAPAAVRDLRENLRGTSHRIVAADSAAFLRQSRMQRRPAPDLVVVDPPRAGLGRDVTGALAAVRPRKITYVSCDPATLSRDLAALVQSGYRLGKMHLLDLFPQTFHLETVTHLLLD
ncbi:MAG TPA: 23S rRNA (uracil(1939)-C(5))-methyltransferase RlmD [Acidobacteriaceae bacterium]|nr:23S rRNA (uracil(1939)-C(5))-methyltransferase RlmD [Acidobacteriaceae bacterium]